MQAEPLHCLGRRLTVPSTSTEGCHSKPMVHKSGTRSLVSVEPMEYCGARKWESQGSAFSRSSNKHEADIRCLPQQRRRLVPNNDTMQKLRREIQDDTCITMQKMLLMVNKAWAWLLNNGHFSNFGRGRNVGRASAWSVQVIRLSRGNESNHQIFS